MTSARLRSLLQSVTTGVDSGPRSVAERLGPWALIAGLIVYLVYETDHFRLDGLPMEAFAGAVVAPFLLGWLALRGRGVRLATVGRAALLTWLLIVAAIAITAMTDRIGRPRLFDAVPRPDLATTIANLHVLDGSPFVLVAIGAVALAIGAAVGTLRRERPSAVEVLAIVTLTWFVLSDIALFQSVPLRDMRLDLRAGLLFDHGVTPYLQAPIRFAPRDPTLLPFLYPPFTLPIFGYLAAVPFNIVATAWLAISVAAAVAALRLFGLSWWWAAALLLWPAFAQGLYVGNVAVPAVVLFAIGPWIGAGVVLDGLFKLQSGIPSLWLVRERRWRALVAGVGGLAAISVTTLPLVGIGSWIDWIHGLQYYEQSQAVVHSLYAFALPGIVPFPVYVALTLVAIVVAGRKPGRQGLARFGVATVVGSPSLFTHGFLVALPAFLSLRSLWFWAAMALTATVVGGGWWAAIAVVAAACLVPALRRELAPSEQWHPLGGARGPWLTRPWRAIDGATARGRTSLDGGAGSG